MIKFNSSFAMNNIDILEDSVGLTYNDILLQPQRGIVNSRSDVDTGHFRIFTAPMDTILDERNISLIEHPNLAKVLPREATKRWVKSIWMLASKPPVGIPSNYNIYSFGLDDIDLIRSLRSYDEPWGICIDIAHGHSNRSIELIKLIRGEGYKGGIMCGSIATEHAAIDCIEAGANLLRVGIGAGAMCSTRQMTNCGVPTCTSIYEVYKAKVYMRETHGLMVKIIADGGIKTPSNCVAALACGADHVMIGTEFARCSNSAAIETDGYKIQRGQASEEYQMEYLGAVRNGCAEGVSRRLKMDYRSIQQKTEYFIGGMRSAASYLGLDAIRDISIKNVKILKCSSTVMLENKPMDEE